MVSFLARDYMGFLEDLEEDTDYRKNVNIYLGKSSRLSVIINIRAQLLGSANPRILHGKGQISALVALSLHD